MPSSDNISLICLRTDDIVKNFSVSSMRQPTVELNGQIERVTYSNEENGYTVARMKVYGKPDLVTVVGNMVAPQPGAVMEMKGRWNHHPKFGEQFQILEYRTKTPATVYGIQRYLGSGLIKGIGPKMAKRIVAKFAEQALEIIENDIERLREVSGIGQKRIRMIATAWAEQQEIREVMLFLQSHGVSTAYATKIFKHYGKASITVVRENPYRLAMDIFGIGFVTADKIAANLGFDKHSVLRVQAGIVYLLHQMGNEGHVYYPYEPLVTKTRESLEVTREVVVDAIGALSYERNIVIEDLNRDPETFRENNKAVYLAKYHVCETGISRRLKQLIRQTDPRQLLLLQETDAMVWVQQQLGISLAENQLAAVSAAVNHKVLVITGGPGTGKTTIIKAILKIFDRLHIKTLLAAPTGRAAKRMQEATGKEAKTIHRLLDYRFAEGGFSHDAENPLHCDALVIDEASMIDTILMHHLLKAVPPRAAFILVGDINQLPSVGAGNVLKDIISSSAVPVITLHEIFRQARQSRIIVNAHAVNNGKMPLVNNAAPHNDFYFIEQEDPEQVRDIILALNQTRIPNHFGFDPIKDIQVLTPMNRGIVGAANLNRELQNALNPNGESIERGWQRFRVHDKVMQIKNNYDKKVFNGDIGCIRHVNKETHEIVIGFDDRQVTYEYSEMDELVLAYAVSVHKSQGSEYPVVILPLLIQHYMLLQRNLIYTGITRGKKLVVVVGTRKALAIGIRNDKPRKRYTYLRYRLA